MKWKRRSMGVKELLLMIIFCGVGGGLGTWAEVPNSLHVGWEKDLGFGMLVSPWFFSLF